MRLAQLEQLHRWHRGHHQPVEQALFSMVATLWLTGWVTLPLAVLMLGLSGALLSGALVAAPAAYASTRRRLHQSGRLRCDWLAATRV
jgi:hypothetical protein